MKRGLLRRRILLPLLVLLTAFVIGAVLAPAALAYRMDVPVWKQSDPRWGYLHLGSSSYTMSGSGCAVTACAMVAAYYGSTKDPGGLCKALSSLGGFTSGGAIYWQYVPKAAGGTISYIGRADYCSLTTINRELDSGYPVVAKVYLKGNTHFVTITGRDGSTYYINDPGYGDRTTLNSRYGSPGTAIKGYRLYHGTHAPPAPLPYTRYEQTASLFTYTGAWQPFVTTGASGGSYTFTDAAATATIRFTGVRLDWIATTGLLQGLASVSVDGKAPANVSLYSTSVVRQAKVWSTGTLLAGAHTVVIAWLGRPAVTGAGTRVNIDAVDVWPK